MNKEDKRMKVSFIGFDTPHIAWVRGTVGALDLLFTIRAVDGWFNEPKGFEELVRSRFQSFLGEVIDPAIATYKKGDVIDFNHPTYHEFLEPFTRFDKNTKLSVEMDSSFVNCGYRVDPYSIYSFDKPFFEKISEKGKVVEENLKRLGIPYRVIIVRNGDNFRIEFLDTAKEGLDLYLTYHEDSTSFRWELSVRVSRKEKVIVGKLERCEGIYYDGKDLQFAFQALEELLKRSKTN